MNQTPSLKPLFSIGVPTYNRKDLLKQTLLSILEQSFADFEVIVGNDFPDETISAESLGIDDRRVRFINNKQNLGELENMNSLLSMAEGRYFTWQFDDDPCAPTFLSEVHSVLTEFGYPSAVFTGYTGIYGTDIHQFKKNYDARHWLYSGRDFLRAYLSGSLKAMGCCGFYNTDYLRNIGGVQRLTNGPMALYSEFLIVIRSGLLSEVAYVDAPLVTTRVHEQSWTCSSSDAELFKQAGVNLIRESMIILSSNKLTDDFRINLSSILKSVICGVVVRTILQGKQMSVRELHEYISSIEEEFVTLKGSLLYQCAVSCLNNSRNKIPLYIVKAKIKRFIPFRYLKYAHLMRSIVTRYTNKAF